MRPSHLSRALILAKNIPHHAPPFSFFAWQRIQNLYAQIKTHPFNMELAQGTLSPMRFSTYLSQDAFYLDVYHKVLIKLASLLDQDSDTLIVNQFATGCLDEKSPSVKRAHPNHATLNYTNFLLKVMHDGSQAEIAAAVLPCFWIYYALARDIRFLFNHQNNPYHDWIVRYSSDKFAAQVHYMQQLTNRLAEQNSSRTKARMLDLFETATQMELNFWRSAYEAPLAMPL